jgi:hypothetical protein
VQQHTLPDNEVERHGIGEILCCRLAEVDFVASVWDSHSPSPRYDRIRWDVSSGVNQEMNIFWQNVGNVSDDVTA